MAFQHDFTQSTGRAITTRDSVVLKFTVVDKDGQPRNLASVTVGKMEIREGPDEPVLVTKEIGSGMTVDPNQTVNTGDIRVELSGGVAGDTDLNAGMHFYDCYIELTGKRQYFIPPQSKMEFVAAITR